MKVIVGITGASGALFALSFLRRLRAEKILIVSRWGARVLRDELGMEPHDLAAHADGIEDDEDLASPIASGSNPFDAFVVIPCTTSTLAKIANGIADTLIARVAQVALKERRRLILCLRETPLATSALENGARLSREGVVIAPIAPPLYGRPETIEALADAFSDKLLGILGIRETPGWRSEERA